MRILVVDDHTLFRDAVALVLRQLAQDLTLIHAATAGEALAATKHYQQLDLILLDLALPGGGGLSVMDALRESDATVPIVVVSASDRTSDVRDALDAGASGYIPKTLSGHEMLAALGQILDGDIFVPAALLAQIQDPTDEEDEVAPEHGDEGARLTSRQLEILRLMAQGLPNKGIAKQLELTEGTVKLHVSAVLRTLGTRNRTEAVMLAQQHGLLPES